MPSARRSSASSVTHSLGIIRSVGSMSLSRDRPRVGEEEREVKWANRSRSRSRSSSRGRGALRLGRAPQTALCAEPMARVGLRSRSSSCR
eukprot:3753319-Pleurochrysis_carterae.AAC.1